MSTKEKAATGSHPARPKVQNKPEEFTASAPAAQVETVRVWRITRRPFRIGRRGADLPEAAFNRLETFLQQADYCWLHARDGRSLALVEGDYYERIRRAAYGHAPTLDPLELDALKDTEAEARGA